MSLAPFYYRNVMRRKGGPIRKVRYFLERDFVTAYAFLAPSLLPDWIECGQIFDSVDGVGSHRYRNVAFYKAISEALERWAFYATVHSDSAKKLGFDIEPSSTGMACFPSFFSTKAKRSAMCEAIERWSLSEWWHGNLSHQFVDSCDESNRKVMELATPFKNHHTILTWEYDQVAGRSLHAVATSPSLVQAKNHSEVELERKRVSLQKFLDVYPGFDPAYLIEKLAAQNEKKFLYFCIGDGVQEFEDRIQFNSGKATCAKPRLLVDCEILGPWSRYGKVWRCLFESKGNLTSLESKRQFCL